MVRSQLTHLKVIDDLSGIYNELSSDAKISSDWFQYEFSNGPTGNEFQDQCKCNFYNAITHKQCPSARVSISNDFKLISDFNVQIVIILRCGGYNTKLLFYKIQNICIIENIIIWMFECTCIVGSKMDVI